MAGQGPSPAHGVSDTEVPNGYIDMDERSTEEKVALM